MAKSMYPYSQEAEMSVLGAILLDEKSMSTVKACLSEDSFFMEKHRLIYSAMSALHSSLSPIDLITMTAQLSASGNLNAVGGAAYLAMLVDLVPTSANIQYYINIVRDKHIRRRLVVSANEAIKSALDEETGVDDILQEVKSNVLSVSSDASHLSDSDLMTLDMRMSRYSSYVSSLSTLRFQTGFPEIDAIIRGIAPGEVMTIIAYSGTWKTCLLSNLLLRNIMKTGLHHIFFSLEMPIEKVFEREAQMTCNISARQAEQSWGMRSDDYRKTMKKNGSEKLLVCEKPKLSVAKIASYIEVAQNKYGKIGGVGIDYLGLMQAEGKSIFDKTSALAADIKILAKELRVPVLLLGQVNRGYSVSKKLEIEMDAAKGSGDIEAGADFMLGMWMRDDKVFAKILKNRNGRVGDKWQMDIDMEHQRFIGTLPYTEPATRSTAMLPDDI